MTSPQTPQIAPTSKITFTGRIVDLADPRPEDICLKDIAWHLSGINRWTGATQPLYDVACHSVYVSQICIPAFAPWALLHDAAEAYLGDVSSPLKAALSAAGNHEYEILTGAWNLAISKRFGVQIQNVKRWDLEAMLAERRDLRIPCDPIASPWYADREGYTASAKRVVPKTRAASLKSFLDQAERLGIHD